MNDPSAAPEVPEVDVESFAAAHASGATVIDVREPDEYEAGHVPGATLIPLGEVGRRVAEIPTEGTVYVICHSGGRSLAAARALRQHAGVDAVNVAGGTSAWIESGREVAAGPRAG